jgi:hypothetical protein
MQSGGAFIGWHVSIADCAGTAMTAGTGYYNTHNVFVSTTLPSGWTPMLSTGGGGSTTELLPVELHLQSGTVLNDTRYPDHGQPGLITADRVFHLDVPSPFTTATWRRLNVGVYNVQANLTAALTVTLRNVSTSTSVATHTFASGASPGGTNHELTSTDAIASGTFSDRQKFQWHIEAAQAINSFGLWAACWYQFS